VILEKGVLEFIKAAKNLKKEFKNWKFLIVGPLDYDKPSKFSQDTINMWKKDKDIQILGYKENTKIYYKNSAIICLPSYREGTPKTILEASASGRPVITTNVTGCKDSIINKKTGELCKVKSVSSLKTALKKLIKDKKLREYYGKNARELAIRKYDIKIVTSKIFTLYNSLINEKINIC